MARISHSNMPGAVSFQAADLPQASAEGAQAANDFLINLAGLPKAEAEAKLRALQQSNDLNAGLNPLRVREEAAKAAETDISKALSEDQMGNLDTLKAVQVAQNANALKNAQGQAASPYVVPVKYGESILTPAKDEEGNPTLKPIFQGERGSDWQKNVGPDGTVSWINRLTGEQKLSSAIDGGAVKTRTPLITKDIVVDGVKHVIHFDSEGNQVSDLGAAEVPKGQAIVNGAGQTEILDTRLKPSSAPGTSTLATSGATGAPLTKFDSGSAPSKVIQSLNEEEPIKHYNLVAERAQTIPALVEQAQKSGNYTIADSAINEELQRLISNQAIRGQAMGLLYKGQPILDKVKGTLASWLEGGNGYTPETRQAAIDTSQMLLGVAQKQRDDAISARRASHPNKEIFDAQVAPSFPGYAPQSTQAQAPQGAPGKAGTSGTTPSGIKYKILR